MEQKQKIDKRSLRSPSFTKRMKIDPTKAKRVELEQSTVSGKRAWKNFVFDCINNCGNEFKCSYGSLYTSTGMCRSCATRKRPYEFILGTLKSASRIRGYEVDLTYEEFLEFVKIGECHYCGSHLPWQPHAIGQNYPKGYFLDRIDNSKGYSKQNCVPCCTSCNFIRQDKLSHPEMMLLSDGLRKIMLTRNLKQLVEFANATELN